MDITISDLQYKDLEDSFKLTEANIKRASKHDTITFIKKFGSFYEVKQDCNAEFYTSLFFINAIKSKALNIIKKDFEVCKNIIRFSLSRTHMSNIVKSEKELLILEANAYKFFNDRIFIQNGSHNIIELQLFKTSDNGKELMYKVVNDLQIKKGKLNV